jgi:hypothetical protein
MKTVGSLCISEEQFAPANSSSVVPPPSLQPAVPRTAPDMPTSLLGSSRHLWSVASFQITRFHNQKSAYKIHHIGDIEFPIHKFYRKLQVCNRLIPNVGAPEDIIMKTTSIIMSPHLLSPSPQPLIILIFLFGALHLLTLILPHQILTN